MLHGIPYAPPYVIEAIGDLAAMQAALDDSPAVQIYRQYVDAYRLGGASELNDIDLDATLADAVTLVEWGRGVAEWLAEDRLEISIERPRGAGAGADDPMGDEPRRLAITAHGDRWKGLAL